MKSSAQRLAQGKCSTRTIRVRSTSWFICSIRSGERVGEMAAVPQEWCLKLWGNTEEKDSTG